MTLGHCSCRAIAFACASIAIVCAPSAAAAQDLTLARCAALPETVPFGLSVELVERGASPGMRHRTVVSRGTPCPELGPHAARLERMSRTTRACVAIDDIAARQLWARLRVLHVDRIVRHRVAASPHRGGRSVRVTWRGGACELADLGDVAIAPASMPAFDLVVAATEAALELGSPAQGTCVAETSPPPFLDAFVRARVGTRHRVHADWIEAQRTWSPSQEILSLRHQPSRLEWVNLGELGLRADGPRTGFVLTFTVVAVDMQPLPMGSRGERMARATYRARIDSACAATAAR